MSETFSLTVNGKAETVSALPDTPLIYVLRNQLGLKGRALWLRAGAMRLLHGAG